MWNSKFEFTLIGQETKVWPDVWWWDRKTLLKAHQQQLKISQYWQVGQPRQCSITEHNMFCLAVLPGWPAVWPFDRKLKLETEPLWQLIWLVDNNCYWSFVIILLYFPIHFVSPLSIYCSFVTIIHFYSLLDLLKWQFDKNKTLWRWYLLLPIYQTRLLV